jgi:hypothetical protein
VIVLLSYVDASGRKWHINPLQIAAFGPALYSDGKYDTDGKLRPRAGTGIYLPNQTIILKEEDQEKVVEEFYEKVSHIEQMVKECKGEEGDDTCLN